MKFYHKAQVHVSESKTFVQSKIIPAVQIGREREREREYRRRCGKSTAGMKGCLNRF